MTLSLYRGYGGSITFGVVDGKKLLKVKAGVGLGAGIKWAPGGGLPGDQPKGKVGDVSIAVNAVASFSFGPLNAELKAEKAATLHVDKEIPLEGRAETTSGITPSLSLKMKQGFGLGIGGSAGVEMGVILPKKGEAPPPATQ